MTEKQKRIFVTEILPSGGRTENLPQLLLDRAPEMERSFDEEGGLFGFLQRIGLLDTISKLIGIGIGSLSNHFKKGVVKPNMPPVISCPRSFEVTSDPGKATALVTWPEPNVSDREDPRSRLTVRRVQGEPSGSRMAGKVHVKYIVSDSGNRQDFCSFTVTVKRVMCMPQQMTHGYTNCSTNFVYYGTMCHLLCEGGYELTGPPTIRCQKNGQYSSPSSQCKPVQCPILELPDNGEKWTCGDANNFQSHCSLVCKNGFRLESDERVPWQIGGTKCQANKTWTLLPVCKDIRAPRITNCPSGFLKQYADRGRTSTVVMWDELEAEDNSDKNVAIILKKGNESGSRFEVGSHEVKYEAVDDAGLTDDCSFMVNVVTRSCRIPIFPHRRLRVNCPHQFTHGSSCSVSCTHGINVLGARNISCELINGYLTWDTPGGTPSCDDIRAPRITNCPSGFLKQYADRGRTSALVLWDELEAEDNSDKNVAIILKKGNESGSRFEVGSHEVKYEAVDDAGLTDDCSFMVNVVTRSCRIPIFPHRRLRVNCPHQFTHGSSCSVSCTHGINVLGASNISCELINGYLTWDTPGGTPSCDEKPCIDPKDPPNSKLECKEFSGGRICNMKCTEGFIRARNTRTSSLVCNPSEGKWTNETMHGCVRKREASILQTSFGYYWLSRCTDEDTQNVTDTFEELMTLEILYTRCPMCTADNIRAACKANRRGKKFMVVKMEVQKGIFDTDTDDIETTRMEMGMVGQSIYVWLRRKLKTLNIIGRNSRVVSRRYPTSASCEPQYAPHKTSRVCAACGVGFEYDGQTGCRKCGPGTYQDDTGNLKCRPCPAGTSTVTLGRSRKDCIAPCPKGAFSNTGLEPCTKCPKGQYQEGNTSTTCQPCAEGEVTPSVGSEQQSDCYEQSSKVFRLRIKDTGSTFVTLKWGKPAKIPDTLIGYDIAFHKASESKDTRTKLNDTSSVIHTVTINGLEPLTEYMVYVWAVTVKGPGVERHLTVNTTNVTATTTQIPTTTTVDPTLCPPGTNSRTGRKRPDGTCKPCGYGFFQEKRGRKKCKLCKQDLTTWYKGSASRKDCVVATTTEPSSTDATTDGVPFSVIDDTNRRDRLSTFREDRLLNY